MANNKESFILIKGCRCLRCNHEWRPKNIEEEPTVCPKCKSPYWNKPKKIIENDRK